MKKTNIIINIVLIVAVAALYVLHFCNHSACNKENVDCTLEKEQVAENLPIAYINVDSLLLQYEYSIELNDQLLRKRENSQASYNQKARQFEQEAAEFQRKLENNAFLSEQRARSEQERLIKKQQDLQELDQRLSNELATEMQNMNIRLQDSIYNYLNEYNKQKNYHLIISNSANDNILIGAPAYDITDEVLEALNVRYNNSKPGKKSKK